jgi:hypothetical protein
MNKLILITLIFLTFSCKKKPDEEYIPVHIPCTLSKNLDTARLYIQGTWQWLEEKRYNRGLQKTVYLTPQNQGYTLTMKLHNDTARFSRNNQPDSVYKYRVVRLKEISGTNFPEDEDPVIVFINISTDIRQWYVPIKICDTFLVMQSQYTTSLGGEGIYKKL